MMRQSLSFVISAAVLMSVAAMPALAQDTGGDSNTMRGLLRQGFEIKAMAPNGAQYVVLLQKDTSAYACEFVTVTNSRCRAINQEAQ